MTLILSKHVKDGIVARALAASFDKEAEALTKAEDKLARRAFDAVVPKAEQRVAAKLPARWLRRDKCLRFNVAGRRIMLSAQGAGVAVPSGAYGCNELGVIEAREPLAGEIDAHVAAKEELKARHAKAKAALQQLLHPLRTLKSLSETWPEGREFYRHLEGLAPSASLPSLRVSDVNEMLGLKRAA